MRLRLLGYLLDHLNIIQGLRVCCHSAIANIILDRILEESAALRHH